MARVLIAWELGEAFGHLTRCLRLEQGLVARGHVAALALKGLRLPTDTPDTDYRAARTPDPAGKDSSSPSVHCANVLRVSGFADVRDVARLNAWQGIFALARPDVLVAYHAPTALLAACLAESPHLSICNGFAVPSAVSRWPSIRPWEAISDQALTIFSGSTVCWVRRRKHWAMRRQCVCATCLERTTSWIPLPSPTTTVRAPRWALRWPHPLGTPGLARGLAKPGGTQSAGLPAPHCAQAFRQSCKRSPDWTPKYCASRRA